MSIPPSPSRQTIRLPGYDYSNAGLYFITIVTTHRDPIFGTVVGGVMRLNRMGSAAMAVWKQIQKAHPDVELVKSILMPNHFHCIVRLKTRQSELSSSAGGSADGIGSGNNIKTRPYKRMSLSEAVRTFKSFSARQINMIRGTPGQPVWQRGYYDHVIRNDSDGQRIIEYIQANPLQWDSDEENPRL